MDFIMLILSIVGMFAIIRTFAVRFISVARNGSNDQQDTHGETDTETKVLDTMQIAFPTIAAFRRRK